MRKPRVFFGLMAFWSNLMVATLIGWCHDSDLWVGNEPSSSVSCLHGWISSFISKLGAVFFDFECCEFAKSHFKLQLFSHFWNVNEVFFTSRLVEPFNGLLTFFIFLAYYLRSFLYKGMLLPFFITETHAQPLAFLSCFQDYYLFIYLFIFIYVLWDLFPEIFFFFFLLVFVLQHSFLDLWVFTSNFRLTFL